MVRAKHSIGIHWGTFVLTDEPVDEPPARIKKELARLHMPANAFVTLEHGETRLFNAQLNRDLNRLHARAEAFVETEVKNVPAEKK